MTAVGSTSKVKVVEFLKHGRSILLDKASLLNTVFRPLKGSSNQVSTLLLPWHLVLFVWIFLLMFPPFLLVAVACTQSRSRVSRLGILSHLDGLLLGRMGMKEQIFFSLSVYTFPKHLHPFFQFYPSLMSSSKSLHLSINTFCRCHTSI